VHRTRPAEVTAADANGRQGRPYRPPPDNAAPALLDTESCAGSVARRTMQSYSTAAGSGS
jgi:hypothetical protein